MAAMRWKRWPISHALRLLTAQLISISFFLIFPLHFSFEHPHTDGVFGAMFDALMGFDQPYNQAPSLHISLLVILWVRFANSIATRWRALVHIWTVLIGLSVLTTYQHHFIDIPTGVLAGLLCLWAWPDNGTSPLVKGRLPTTMRHHQLAAYYVLGALVLAALAVSIGGAALWLMAYVYNKVANDKNSNQTPHYGYFDGDGDFILTAPQLLSQTGDESEDVDEVFVVPYIEEEPTRDSIQNKISKVKRLLSDESSTIELYDLMVQEVQHFLSASTEDHFKVQGSYSQEELIARVSKYEGITSDLCALEACIVYWAKPAHRQILQKVLARSTDRLEVQGGLVLWANLRWYPLVLQIYSAGIAAVAGQRYDSLANILLTKVISAEYQSKEEYLVESLSKAILELTRLDVFKLLPGYERNYTPMSEYLLKLLQPALDDILFIGKGYESAFDEFEVLLALVAVDIGKHSNGDAWGPIGRFGYKYRNNNGGPLGRLIATARAQAQEWPPFQHGLFGGSLERFNAVADEYVEMISGLGWH